MQESIETLIKQFNLIKNKGWIESCVYSTAGVGNTFEKELGIERNELPISDYNGIELKCKTYGANETIKLFTANFDGDYLFETERIYKIFANIDERLFMSVSGKYKHSIKNYYVKMFVNYKLKKVQFEIYDKERNLIDNEASWSFDLLKSIIYSKIEYLGYIKAYSKKENNKFYYKYDELYIFKLRDFNMFLKMLNDGYITVKFSFTKYKTGKRKGSLHNHGIAFTLLEKRLNMLFVTKNVVK